MNNPEFRVKHEILDATEIKNLKAELVRAYLLMADHKLRMHEMIEAFSYNDIAVALSQAQTIEKEVQILIVWNRLIGDMLRQLAALEESELAPASPFSSAKIVAFTSSHIGWQS